MTFSRRLGNRILSTLVNWFFGTRYTDLCYGYNAFWAKHLSKLDLDCDGFEVETVMNVRAAKAGLAIQEIPSHEHLRLHGMSNLKVMRDGIRIGRFIVRERFGQSGRRVARLDEDSAQGPGSVAAFATSAPQQQMAAAEATAQ